MNPYEAAYSCKIKTEKHLEQKMCNSVLFIFIPLRVFFAASVFVSEYSFVTFKSNWSGCDKSRSSVNEEYVTKDSFL